MADLYQLARDLGYVAAEMQADGHRYAGGITQVAKFLLELAENEPDPRAARCRRCRAPVVQRATGRPRLYCSDRCRKGRTKPDETVN